MDLSTVCCQNEGSKPFFKGKMLMAVIIADERIAKNVLTARQASGLDRWDEVWEGEYFMAPPPNLDHADLATQLAIILGLTVTLPHLGRVLQNCAVSDQTEDWTTNYRVPDIAVYLNDNPAEARQTHWLGGPDLAIEVVSPNDRTWKKIPFYASVGTKELLIIDRHPWSLALLQLRGDELVEVGSSRPEDGKLLTSHVIPQSWRLTGTASAPIVEVRNPQTGQEWRIIAGAL